MFCHVGQDQVVGVHDVSSTYHVPLLLQSQGIVQFLQRRLALPTREQLPRPMQDKGASLEKRWRELTRRCVFCAACIDNSRGHYANECGTAGRSATSTR